MALKTGGKPLATEPPSDTVLLELAMYAHYTWGGITYERGTAYRFKRDDAYALLAEQDYGRPVWRQFRPAKVKGPVKMPIVDSTEVTALRTRQTLEEAAEGRRPGTNTGRRIDVGTDDEIQDLLSRPDDPTLDIDPDTSEDVTV